MRYLLAVLFIISFAGIAKSQDQIITTKGDTISCKIVRVSDDYIHYKLSDQSSVRSRIGRAEVAFFIQLEEPLTLEEKIERGEDPTAQPKLDFIDDFKTLRVAINTGYTYQYDGYNDPGYTDVYLDQVRSLWFWGGEIHYFSKENFGLGIKINRIQTDTQVDSLFGYSNLKEDIRFHFLALSFLGRQSGIGEKDNFYYGGAVGLVTYRDDGIATGGGFFEQGETVGVSFDLGYDYAIGENLALGITAGVNIARMNSIIINGVRRRADFGISRVDLTFGLRYIK